MFFGTSQLLGLIMALFCWTVSPPLPFFVDPLDLKKCGFHILLAKVLCKNPGHNRVTGLSAFQLRHKLISVRDKFQVWNKEVFRKVENEIHMIQNQLKLV